VGGSGSGGHHGVDVRQSRPITPSNLCGMTRVCQPVQLSVTSRAPCRLCARPSPMKLGLQLGYWGAQPNPFAVALAQEAERLDYDSVWTAEAWGSDAFTPAAWIGAHTSRIRLCTGIVQISARTPASCAMHALTLDHLSNGRFTLGLGVSGPQV